MAADIPAYQNLIGELHPYHARLVAVSKTKPPADVLALYEAGQKIFGENYVQELLQKWDILPRDIEWHFIGHLQSNKVKFIAPFVRMIHAVDNLKLLREVQKQAAKCDRVIDCLLQVHIASEETKFGLDEKELLLLLEEVMGHPQAYGHVRLCGLMGMATNTEEVSVISREFHGLKTLFNRLRDQHLVQVSHFTEISMGMSSDYPIALAEGSTLVRIGSRLFGARTHP